MKTLNTKIIKDNMEFVINDILLNSSKGRLYLEAVTVTDTIDSWKTKDLTGMYYIIDEIDRISCNGDITREIIIV